MWILVYWMGLRPQQILFHRPRFWLLSMECYGKLFRELSGPLPSPILMIAEGNQWNYMVRAWRKTRLKSCISKPVFLTAQQNSANTLHRQLEEEEGFGTDSRLQVLGWKRLDKILHCKQYNKLYFLQAAVPLARIISDHIHILADEQKCIDHFFFGSPAWHAISARHRGKTITNWVGLLLGIRQE